MIIDLGTIPGLVFIGINIICLLLGVVIGMVYEHFSDGKNNYKDWDDYYE